MSSQPIARRTSLTSSSPPKPKPLLLPGLAYPDTPPASPHFSASGSPRNHFSQWTHGSPASSSTAPSSPTLSHDHWSLLETDTESEAGLHSDNEGSLPEGVRTPKGHPLSPWKTRTKGLGLGLGLGSGLGLARFGAMGGRQEVLGLDGEAFEKRNERRRSSIHDRSPFLINTASSSWSMPRLPRAPRKREALYGFMAILFFFVFVSTHSHSLGKSSSRPLSSLPRQRHTPHFADARDLLPLAGPSPRNGVSHLRPGKTVVQHHASAAKDLSEWRWPGKDMELASLLSFIVASDANTVPKVDPSLPLDPSYVLDFDPFSARASKDLRESRAALWRDHPVILLSRTRNAHSRFIKQTLADLHIHPAPLIMDIDQRADADTLLPLFQRLMGQSDLPILLVGGEVVGGWTEVDRLTSMSLLKPLISSHGAFFVPPKHKKKKRSGHGGKTEDELRVALEAEKKADELKRREKAVEDEEERLRLIAQGAKEEIPIEDLSDPENF